MAHILIAEDDRNIAAVMAHILVRLGHTCEIVSDGMTALGRLNAESFDLLIVDLHLPQLSGVELMRRLLSTTSPPRIIACSGAADQKEAAVLADRILRKPFLVEDLRVVVDNLVPNKVAPTQE